MKFAFLMAALTFAGTSFAQFSISRSGDEAYIRQSGDGARSVSAEIIKLASEAHRLGLRDDRGADVFTKNQRVGVGGFLRISSRNLVAESQSGITMSYAVTFKGARGSMNLISSREMTVKGEAAQVLKDALILTGDYSGPRRGPRYVGASRIESTSRRISCMNPAGRAGAEFITCTLKL